MESITPRKEETMKLEKIEEFLRETDELLAMFEEREDSLTDVERDRFELVKRVKEYYSKEVKSLR